MLKSVSHETVQGFLYSAENRRSHPRNHGCQPPLHRLRLVLRLVGPRLFDDSEEPRKAALTPRPRAEELISALGARLPRGLFLQQLEV